MGKSSKKRYCKDNDPFAGLMDMPPPIAPEDQAKQAFIVKCQQQPASEDNDFLFSDNVRYIVNYRSPSGLIVHTAASKQPFGQPKEISSHNPKAEFEGNIVFEVITEWNTISEYTELTDPFAGLGLDEFGRSRTPIIRNERNRSRSRSVSESEQSDEDISDLGRELPPPPPAEPPTLQVTSLKGKTKLQILSSAIIIALKEVVEFYPNKEILSGNEMIWLDEPYPMIVHHWDKLHAYRNQRGPQFDADKYCVKEESTYHDLELILDYVDNNIMRSVEAEKARYARGKATWEMLWLLYQPGIDVVATISTSSRTRACPRGYIVKHISGGPIEGDRCALSVTLQSLDFDGDNLNWAESIRSIPFFEGEIDIADLAIVPAHLPSVEDGNISRYEQLVEKGKRFYATTTPCCKHHSGKRLRSPCTDLDGLVMVDMKAYFVHAKEPRIPSNMLPVTGTTVVTNCSCQVCLQKRGTECAKEKFSGYDGIDPEKQTSLTDHQYFLCPTAVRAFHFKTRDWYYLDVDNLSAPQFKTEMIDTLVMPPVQIKMLKALSKNFVHQDANGNARRMWCADFVEGKGSSQIFLLHGKPGVGKTYTAECIAEHTRRPLMMLTVTDIGTDPEDVERNLEKHFTIAKNWGAILLIDEADVYMEKRATTDLTRNSLVASFLRALETYEGILFLTTNRVGAFDDAFVSRIHVKLYYPPLKDPDRTKIWSSFICKLATERPSMRVTRDAKDAISSKKIRSLELNGREIRNAFQTAVALAEYDDEKDEEGRVMVDEKHILQVAEMAREFKCYLDELHSGDEGRRAVRERERLDDFDGEERRYSSVSPVPRARRGLGMGGVY